MTKINSIIKKNLIILLKNKFTLFILIFGPILIIMIMGFLFNNQNTYNVNIGMYVENNNNLTQTYIYRLQNDGFNIRQFKTENQCIDSIKKGLSHTCLIFPNNFEIKNNNSNTIKLSFDSSHLNIKTINNLIISSLNNQLEYIQLENTQTILNILSNTNNEATQNKNTINNLFKINKELSQNINLINIYIIQLQNSFKADSLNIDDLTKKSQDAKDAIIKKAVEGLKLINYTKQNINNISILLNSANITPSNDGKELKELTDEIIEDTKSLEIKLYSLKDTYKLTSLNEKLEDVENDIKSIENNIKELTSKMEDITLNSVNNINNNTKLINKLNTSNQNILSSLSNAQITDKNSIIKPVNIETSKIDTSSSTNLNPIIPTLFTSIILITSIILSSNLIVLEKKSNAYFRNFLTKASGVHFFIGNFITLFLIIFTQTILIIIIYKLLITHTFDLSMLKFIMLTIPIILTFVLIGMLIGHISENSQTNIILSFITIFLMLAFSGIMLPIELLSQKIITITALNPYLLSESILRKHILFHSYFYQFKLELIALSIYIITFSIIGILFESIEKKRSIYQYMTSIQMNIKKKLKERKEKLNPNQ